LFKWSSL